jgi:hypothetical protein
MKHFHLLVLGGVTSILAVAPAHAVIQYQVVGPVNFIAPPNNTPSIVFPGFSDAPAGKLLMVSVTGPTANSAPMLNFGGFIQGGQFTTAPSTYSATSTPFFQFNNGSGSSFSGSQSNITLTGNPVTTVGLTNLPASGMYSGSFNMINTGPGSMIPTAIQSYFAGSPTINVFNGNFMASAVGGGGIFGNSLTVSGPLYLTYKYDDGNTTPVPGPLPIVGAGLAFGVSRKLRRRIQSSVS